MNQLPHGSGSWPRAAIRIGARAPAWLQWTAAAAASALLVATVWLALFSVLTRWEPGVRVAQAPSLAIDRAPPIVSGPTGEDRVIAR
ncbi:MAG: hypothetical protein ACK4MV_04830 [Beijerinckiaceae bacterium]